jgi:hypothetical protein
VVTGAASYVSQAAAILSGTVDPNGAEVSECRLEYGTSQSYGSSVACTPSPGAGTSAVAVSGSVSNLSADTTYHFRVVATNANGTSYGGDETFQTLTNAPEFGRCVKVSAGAGKYASASCTSLGHARDYEWQPGALDSGFTTASTSKSVTLDPVTGAKVTCTDATGAGEYRASNAVAGVVLALTGCARSGESCSSGAVAGEISSNPLEGVLGIERLGATANRDKIGLELFPAGGTGAVMEFSCGLTSVSVQGQVIVPLATDKMSAKQTLKFKAAKGVQKPQSFATGPAHVLEASFDQAPLVQIGLTMTATLADGEALEVNSVV